MDARHWARVQSVFLSSLERDPENRSAYLEKACGDDDALHREVKAMLAAHQDSQALAIEDAVVEAALPGHDAEALLGTHVGPYRLVRHLGRGGMGDVYLAERDDAQFRQQVAVKLIRPGFYPLDLEARFRAERQILARLIHPHIAPLLDGGVTDDGRPYLVMQYVEGIPLTDYCDQHRLVIEQRLHLFLQVCEAVQFAHRNLIVHRDLKPGNILVTEDGETKLLDFGIAKLLDPDALDVSVALTRSEVRVMTPEYAAPEQFRGDTVTTGTDVYALGVLLYELLTDHRPYRLSSRTPSEVERIVCQEAPRRPSTAITESEEARGSDGTAVTLNPEQVSAARQLPLGRLRKLLRGDLDNIVMMALRKEPTRRHASVEALAEDVRRFLGGRPVSARPDTVGYRVSKFVRRHRLAVGAAALIALLTLGFGVIMAVQAARIAQHARALEEERDRVRRQVEKTTRVKTLVSDLFKVVDPNETDGGATEQLQAAARRIVQDLDDQGELQAELMDEVITIYMNLGLYEEARDMAHASLEVRQATFGAGEPAVAWGLRRLGETLFANGQFAEAEEQYRMALLMQRAILGDDHADVARILVRLSQLYGRIGRNEEAEARAVEARAIYRTVHGDAHPQTAEALYHLALARSRLVGTEVAEPLLRDALAVQREALGDDHPEVARTLVALARMATEQERFDVAEPLLQEALAIYHDRYGDHHIEVSRTLIQIGRLHLAKQDLDRAEAAFRRALEARRQRYGNDHVATAASMIWLGQVLTSQGAYRQAEELLLEALPIRRAQHGVGHWLIYGELKSLVELYDAWGRPRQAARYRRLQDEMRQELDAAAGS